MGRSKVLFAWLMVGYAFLYIPICSLVFYSFNKSKLVTVWGGFSTRWYSEVLNNDAIMSAAWLSLKIAFISSSVATIFGTLAGYVMVRWAPFRGGLLFSGMITAPLVMPVIITGISLLLLFVSLEQLIGWPASRGVTTVTIAHITFSMAFVAVIIQSRLANMDLSIEEAAMDLGSRPVKVFFTITVPMIFPAIMTGWLLAFTLSIDDLVISSFVSGPNATTLPMLVFSKIRLGVAPDVNALASIMILIVSVSVIGAFWFSSVNQRKQEKITTHIKKNP